MDNESQQSPAPTDSVESPQSPQPASPPMDRDEASEIAPKANEILDATRTKEIDLDTNPPQQPCSSKQRKQKKSRKRRERHPYEWRNSLRPREIINGKLFHKTMSVNDMLVIIGVVDEITGTDFGKGLERFFMTSGIQEVACLAYGKALAVFTQYPEQFD